MNERIKALRKTLNLTQQEFADRIGVKRGTIANYEIGRNKPVDAIYSLICREFNVNKDWLRNGKGNMFINTNTLSLDEFAEANHLTELEKKILCEFIKLSPDIRKAILDFMKSAYEVSDEIITTKDTAEAAYIKSISNYAKPTDSSLSSTIDGTEIKKAN